MLILAIGMLLLVMPSGHISASQPMLEGVARFGVSLSPSAQIDGDGVWTVAVWVWCDGPSPSATGTVKIQVDGNATIIEGAVTKVVHPTRGWKGPSDRHWIIKLRKSHDGTAGVRASLHLPGRVPDSYSEFECRAIVDLKGRRVTTLENRKVIAYSAENGRRFRYGGWFPVAMEDDDLESPDRIDALPVLISDPTVSLDVVSSSDPAAVRVVASVGKAGQVIWVRPQPMDGEVLSIAAWDSVVSAVKQFHFRPATSHGRPVTENAIVLVRIVEK
jgi:hypothetical protein